MVRAGKYGRRHVLYAVNLSQEPVGSWIMLRDHQTMHVDEILYDQTAYHGISTDRFQVDFLPEQSKILVYNDEED
jgi:hypothetical protein